MPRGKGRTGYGKRVSIAPQFKDKTMCQLKVTSAYKRIPPHEHKSKANKLQLQKLLTRYN